MKEYKGPPKPLRPLDEKIYRTMLRYKKGWDWMKLNHPDTWKVYWSRHLVDKKTESSIL